MVKKRACVLVYDCLTGNTYINFQKYFSHVNHTKPTQNNNVKIKLTKVRLKYSQNSFCCMGAKVFNDLPTNLKIINDRKKF